MRQFRVALIVCAGLLAGSLGGCASNTGVKAQGANFDWSQVDKRILIVQPDISLGEVTAGGLVEPRADWTKSAKGFVEANLTRFMEKKQVATVEVDNLTDPREIQLTKLHGVVGKEVLLHAIGGIKLPNKGTAMDWTLGPGTKILRDHYGTDYAMFIYVNDTYTSSGRAAVIAGAVVVCAFLPVCVVPTGGSQVGFVSLVDLRTGNIVWFNVRADASGDLRNDKDAGTFVSGILKDMPL